MENVSPTPEASLPVLMVTYANCREFLTRLGATPETWQALDGQKEWGGHLHRAVLRVAMEEADDDEVVDLFPVYAELLVAEGAYGKKLAMLNFAAARIGEEDPLGDFARSLRYGPSSTRLPWEE